ncbi:hypothetical protein HNQ94_001713 [Salirhabdus euzebyi]|uniref:Uncharacterized protein n=1 Tax=Salirhabdus euzebyi TaxID=394506 RepID=A0A841Q4E6_9BACI|nr:hypothetical protein [Salirhabdus euzebyi]MBB6453265.1 hypothetical protein [Salirhabdus euzebyi]
MSDFNLKGFDSIKVDKKLISETSDKILKQSVRKKSNRAKSVWIAAASVIIAFGTYFLFQNGGSIDQASPSDKGPVVTEDGGINIPAIKIPENNVSADMIGLIVYNGKIYTQTDTEIDQTAAKNLIGEKLGTTKATIDEWSSQDEYAVEFASTIGVVDVYTVQGYDKDFRIMAYGERHGEIFSEFYDCLNGITIHNGKDLFGKLNLVGNVTKAEYRSHDDWYYSVDNFRPLDDEKLVHAFIDQLNETTPHPYDQVEEDLGEFRNDEHYRELTLHLEDGSRVRLVVIKDGYVRYGFSSVYFKMEQEVFTQLWDSMTIH